MKKRLLFIFSLVTLFYISSISAQETEFKNKPYFSFSVGTFLVGDGFSGTIQTSAGYQLNKWIGIGGGYGLYSSGDLLPLSFKAFNLEYRLLHNGYVFTLAGGLGYDQNKTEDSVYEYRQKDKFHPFYRINIGKKLGKVFTLGATIWIHSPEMELWGGDGTIDDPNDYLYQRDETLSGSSLALTLGININ